MADEVQTPSKGWYDDPDDPDKLRYWDGSQWTDRFLERRNRGPGAGSQSAPLGNERADRPARVRFQVWFWLLLIAATLGILWGAAEQHDQSCYSKTLAQVSSGNLSESNCLLLPWNDPAEGSGLR